MTFRRFVGVILLVLVIIVVSWAGYKWTHPVSVGTLRLALAEVPADIQPLEQWLSTQPNVMQEHIKFEGNTLTIDYKMPGRDVREYAQAILQECRQTGIHDKGYTVESVYNPFL